MLLALDVGNTQVFGGLIDQGEVVLNFRRSSKTGASSDEIGIFLRTVLRENGFDPKSVTKIAICSVVPADNHSINNALIKYFEITPFFVDASSKCGFINKIDNPEELGADRIVNAIAGVHRYPNTNLIIIDMGTATTFCAINAKAEYLGGVIMAGLRLSNEALGQKAAKLSNVEIKQCRSALGTDTIKSMQSGLYYGHLGACREVINKLGQECFANKGVKVIGTGGFSSLYESENIFDETIPDLVLHGLQRAVEINSI